MIRNRAWFSRYNIKARLLTYLTVVFLLVVVCIVIITANQAHFLGAYSSLNEQYAGLNAFYNALDEATSEITTYYRTRNSYHYTRYSQILSSAQAQLQRLHDLTGNEVLRWEYHKLYNMTLTYRETVERTLETAQGVPVTLDDYARINRLNELIRMTSNRLYYAMTLAVDQESASVLARGQNFNIVSAVAIGLLALFCLFFLIYMIRGVTLLLENENDNLRTRELLAQTELKALQSQVNPHFLFNTLSIISKTAYIENAAKTVDMLESTTALLRYGLDSMSDSSDLEREFESIRNYLYIQSNRLGQRITMNLYVQPDLPNVAMPALIVQPFVENAIIHGVFHMESGGKVEVSAKRQDEFICIKITDNGVGMPAETVEKFWADSESTDARGIGVLNVKKRIEIFFENKHLLMIDSTPGCGTVVTVLIPVGEGENV